MNTDSVDSGIISLEYLPTQQYLRVNNQQGGNSTENQTKSEKLGIIINKVKKAPMTPTPLYISFFSSQLL